MAMAEAAVAPAPPTRPWADLSPDLLLDVSARLRDAADFVRFHAVCKPWRDSTPLPVSPATFLPRLLASCNDGILRSRVNYSGHPSPPPSSYHRSCASSTATGDGEDRNWVASADGTAAWLFDAGDADEQHPSLRLLDFLTGAAVTPLPRFTDDGIRQQMANPRGVVYGDGTFFLYSFTPTLGRGLRPWHDFTAALLRPGDATWTATRKRFFHLEDVLDMRHSGAAFHDGKILVGARAHDWHVLTPGNVDSLHPYFPYRDRRTLFGFGGDQDRSYLDDHSYVFESRGELLSVSVVLEPDKLGGGGGSGSTGGDDVAPKLSVRVHALKADWYFGAWAERDGRSFGDRVMFLGSPVSFARDAAQLGLSGGCVYFFFRGRVMTYNLVNDEAKLLGWLPPELGANGSHVWLSPQPTIAPISGNQTGLEPPNKKQRVSIS